MGKKRKLPSSQKKPEPEPKINEEEEEDPEEESEDEEEEEEEEEEKEEEEDEEEEDDDLIDRETLRKILEPFGKDQIIELLKDAAARNPGLVVRISASAESDPVHRNIFVRGIGWDCTTDTLAAAFRPHGDIEECHVIADPATGRSKGYGFVLFRTRKGTRKALKDPNKVIGGRPTSCQLASKGKNPSGDGMGRKVLVSNIGADVNPERLRAFFAKFGEIEEGPLGFDKGIGKLRRFVTFVYRTPEGCRKALEEPIKIFEGCALQCQKALEGVKPKVPGAAMTPAMPVSGSPLQPNDLTLAYASGSGLVRPAAGLLGQGMGGQSGGVGLLNPAAGISLPVNRSGTPVGVNTVSPSITGSYQSQVALQVLGAYQSNQLSSVAAMNPVNRSGTPLVVNTVSPSVTGSYQSQVALQGLGAYQSNQLSSVAAMNPVNLSGTPLGINTVSPGVTGSYQSQVALQGLRAYQSNQLSSAASMNPVNRSGTPMGVNTVSPSVIGSYQSQVALQGLGAYHSNQLSSVAAMNPGMRSQSGLGSSGTGLSSYLGR